MNAENLQQTIVDEIDRFLSRARMRWETLPRANRPNSAVEHQEWLRSQLASEIGPKSRFRLIAGISETAT